MNVYVLARHEPYEGDEVIGVFATPEAAMRYTQTPEWGMSLEWSSVSSLGEVWCSVGIGDYLIWAEEVQA